MKIETKTDAIQRRGGEKSKTHQIWRKKNLQSRNTILSPLCESTKNWEIMANKSATAVEIIKNQYVSDSQRLRNMKELNRMGDFPSTPSGRN